MRKKKRIKKKIKKKKKNQPRTLHLISSLLGKKTDHIRDQLVETSSNYRVANFF